MTAVLAFLREIVHDLRASKHYYLPLIREPVGLAADGFLILLSTPVWSLWVNLQTVGKDGLVFFYFETVISDRAITRPPAPAWRGAPASAP
jgi:hypothetical protein